MQAFGFTWGELGEVKFDNQMACLVPFLQKTENSAPVLKKQFPVHFYEALHRFGIPPEAPPIEAD